MTRTELIALLRHYQKEFDYNPFYKDAADMLEADAEQRSKPHGHCTHPTCREIWALHLEQTRELSRLTGKGSPMILNSTDKLREAARLALSALDGLFGTPNEYTGGGGGVAVWRLGGSDAPQQAIAALKEAGIE